MLNAMVSMDSQYWRWLQLGKTLILAIHYI
jgi:hypothetical protein